MKEEKVYNKWLILGVLVMMPFVASLDSSIVNVALPSMAKDLATSTSSIAWVITSYLIAISATIIIFGRISDIIGKSVVFNFGVALFTIGSLLCGISSSVQFLILSRVIQGIGAAGAMATNQAIITTVFPPHQRGRALGLSGSFVAIGGMVGAPLGGIIVSNLSWHYIFLINIPIGVIASILAFKILPKAKEHSKEKIDTKGAVLFAVFVVSLFTGMINGQEIGYNHLSIILAFIIAIGSFILFLKVEKNTEKPLLELSLFKNGLFSLSLFCAFISFASISCLNIIMPFYFQGTLSFSPAKAGIIMMIAPIILSFTAPLSGYISDKIGSELISFLGLLLMSIGLLSMAVLNQNSVLTLIIVLIVIVAAGNALFQSPNTSMIMSLVPREKLGITGSMNALTRNLGLVFGTSFSTTVLYNAMSLKVGHRVSDYTDGNDAVFIFGMKWVYIFTGCICLIGVILSGLRLYKMKKISKK